MESNLKGNVKYPLKEITDKIISSAIEVHTILGPGLLERVYEDALSHEFSIRGIVFERQKEINLLYKGKNVGSHRIDFLVENEVVLELKAIESIHRIHEAQLITYLKAMNKKIGLIINFNVKMLRDGIKRLII